MLPTSKSNMVFEEKFTYKNNQNDLEKLLPDFSAERKKRLVGHVCIFYQSLVYTSENYSNFKNVLINIWSIIEINDCYRTRGNVNFNE